MIKKFIYVALTALMIPCMTSYAQDVNFYKQEGLVANIAGIASAINTGTKPIFDPQKQYITTSKAKLTQVYDLTTPHGVVCTKTHFHCVKISTTTRNLKATFHMEFENQLYTLINAYKIKHLAITSPTSPIKDIVIHQSGAVDLYVESIYGIPVDPVYIDFYPVLLKKL